MGIDTQRMTAIKTRLRSILKRRRVSLRKLELVAGVPKSTTGSALKENERDIGFFTIVAIAQSVGFSLDWLAGLPPRQPGELKPDEQEILDLYQSLQNKYTRTFALRQMRTIAESDQEYFGKLDEEPL